MNTLQVLLECRPRIRSLFGKHVRVGIGYLYTDAGKAELDAIDSDDSLKTESIGINQLLLQLTYLH